MFPAFFWSATIGSLDDSQRSTTPISGQRLVREDPVAGVEPPRYTSIGFAEPRRFAGRVTYDSPRIPINATGSKKMPSAAR